ENLRVGLTQTTNEPRRMGHGRPTKITDSGDRLRPMEPVVPGPVGPGRVRPGVTPPRFCALAVGSGAPEPTASAQNLERLVGAGREYVRALCVAGRRCAWVVGTVHGFDPMHS